VDVIVGQMVYWPTVLAGSLCPTPWVSSSEKYRSTVNWALMWLNKATSSRSGR